MLWQTINVGFPIPIVNLEFISSDRFKNILSCHFNLDWHRTKNKLSLY
jgi:hypothetical protein